MAREHRTRMSAESPLQHPYYTAYAVGEGKWRASTDLGYFHGTSPSDVRQQYENAREREEERKHEQHR